MGTWPKRCALVDPPGVRFPADAAWFKMLAVRPEDRALWEQPDRRVGGRGW